jgi:acyl-CoA thioesterase-1
VRRSVLLLPLVLLTGCASPFGESGPRTYGASVHWPAIVCLGDSITAGDAAPTNESYPAWLQKRLNTGGYHYRVVNAGHSGDRTADGLARLRSDVLAYHPAVVVVELGSNDPGHTPAPVWQSQLSRIVSRILAHHARVILGGLNEPGMTEIYRGVAARYRIPLVWMTSGLWSRPGLWGDAHHPNGAGYRVVMQNVWRALRPMLKR